MQDMYKVVRASSAYKFQSELNTYAEKGYMIIGNPSILLMRQNLPMEEVAYIAVMIYKEFSIDALAQMFERME